MNSLAFFLLDLHQPQYIKAMIPFQHNLDHTHSVPYHLMSLLKQHHDLHPIQERLHYIDYCGLKNSILFLHAILTISQILKISILLRNYMKSYTMNLKSCNPTWYFYNANHAQYLISSNSSCSFAYTLL